MLGEKSFEELKCLKRELKAWESMFERKHSRRPNKDDVNNAPEEIKETYVKYKNLRKNNDKPPETPRQEEEEEGDEVWGKSLNKSSKKVGSITRSVRIQLSPSDYKPIRLCHGQRPKKLLNNLDKCSTGENLTNNDETNVVPSTDDSPASTFGDNIDLGFSITSTKLECLSKPGMMLGKSKVTQKMKRRSTIDSDWLEKNKPELPDQPEESTTPPDTNLCTTNEIQDFVPNTLEQDLPHYTEDSFYLKESSFSDIADDVSMPENCKINSIEFHAGKTGSKTLNMNFRKNSSIDENISTGETLNSTKLAGKSANSFDGDYQCTSNFMEFQNGKTGKTLNTRNTRIGENSSRKARRNFVEDDCLDGINSDEQFTSASANITCQEISLDYEKHTDFKDYDVTSDDATVGTFGDSIKKLPNTEDVNVFDQNCSQGVSASKGKRKRSEDEIVENEEIGEKRRKIMKGNSDDDGSEKEEKATESKKSSKRSSGLVSENFRALNMKVKRFCRGGRGTNYGAYKRKLWKQKQQAKEQGEKKPVPSWVKSQKKTTTAPKSRSRIMNSTNTTCFKCQEDGHWAKDCPRNKPQRATNTENWSEPVNAPADLDIGDEQWKATESKLEFMLADRLPRPHTISCNAPPAIEPLYQAENDKPISTPKEVYNTLHQLGFDSFRPGQEEAIMQILSGLSTLVVLSTGAGKSLCYQLPAYMYSQRSPCLTLVISPLVSLMEDQVVGLPFGLCGVSLNTNMTKPQRQRAVDKITSGEAAVVLVSPEALVGGNIGPGCLPHVSKLPPIAFACIDEAHCVSEWSHNFRPSYLRVCRVLREKFGVRCFLGLTATATKSTALSVAEHLGISQRPDAIIRGATIPDNLNLSVSSDLNRDRAMLELLQGSRFSDCDSIIIYCTRREQTDRVATYLRTCLQKNPLNTSSCITDEKDEEMEEQSKGEKRGRKKKSGSKAKSKAASWQAECYHAGMSGAQRRKVQTKFMSGELRIVVATVAFGMGLDKANVRAIIHYNLPKSFESYVQEIGRAGRDGLPSHCHVFIDPQGKDVRELRRHAYASTIDRKMIKKLVAIIFPTCDCKTLEANMRAKRELGLRAAAHGMQGESFDFMEDDQILDHVMELEARIDNGSISSEVVNTTEANHVVSEASGGNTANADISEATAVDASEELNGSTDGDARKENTHDDNDANMCDAHEENKLNEEYTRGGANEECTRETHEENSHDAHEGYSRVCGGHEVAFGIAKAVQTFDMKEEGIATLLCYLELHEKKWVQILQPVRSTCTLKFYGGPAHLHFVAQRVPLVTAAVAYAREKKVFERKTSSLTFPMVEVIDKMCWDLEPARRELYGLQWNEALRLPGESGLSAGHSGVVVEFSDLAFHIRAPGDLSDEERDQVCDFLEDRIMAQERSQLSQLHGVWSTFNVRAHSNCWQSSEECDKKVDEQLKSIVKAYFESENDLTKTELNTLSEARKKCQFVKSTIPDDAEEPVNWDSVSRDVRAFLNLHADAELSGRAIARVFHGIDSPCFPASTWGRDRRFWRRHLDVDFNQLRKFAIKELVRYK